MATDLRTDQTQKGAPRRTGPRSMWARRSASALPGVILVVVFGFFLVDKRSEALTAFRSARALLIIGGIIVGWIVVSWLLRRFVRWVWVRSVVLTAGALALALVLVRPYYVNKKVVESERVAVGGKIQRPSAPAPTTSPTGPGAPATTTPAAPVQVSTGSFRGIGHSASGQANVIRKPDGTFVVELRDIDIQSTPDPHVYLARGADRESLDGAIELAKLRGNQGTQYYDVPQGTTPGAGWTVLVWCRRFDTPIAGATQNPV